MINECGHSLCKNCVDNLFARNTGPCPTCARTLKKQSFWIQTFDDPNVEKEVHFRKKLAKIFNLQEDDFPTLRAYNDYLEEFETIVYNLVNEIEVTKTQQLVADFTVKHKEQIEANRNRKNADELYISRMMDEEAEFQKRLKQYHESDLAAMAAERETTEKAGAAQRSLMHELARSDMPAELIVDRQRQKTIENNQVERQRAADVAKKEQQQGSRQQEVRGQRGRAVKRAHSPVVPFTYHMLDDVLSTPNGDDERTPMHAPHLAHMTPYVHTVAACTTAQLAGGFTAELMVCRALTAALCDLMYRL